MMKTIEDRFRRLFKLRFAVLYPAALYLAIFCNIDMPSLLPGVVIVALGVVVRLWSNCYAIKMGKLTTSGPYAFVRNPLYLGTALIMLGVIVVLRIYLLGAVFFGIAGMVYYRTIMSEQKMLTKKFGRDFLDYLKHVPAMVPRFTAYAGGEKWPASLQRLQESREHKVGIWLAVAVVLFYLKRILLVEKQPFGNGEMVLIIVIIALALADLGIDRLGKRMK